MLTKQINLTQKRPFTYLRSGILVLWQPARVFEQQDFIVLNAVDVEGPEKLTQPP